MVMPTYEYELETDMEGEYEWESEYEADLESEEFFGRLAKLARQAVQSPALRRVGLQAARSALSGAGLGPLGGLLPQGEEEFEWEWEEEASPTQRIYTQALMEHLGHAAATAETEEEAEAFLPALIPLAAKLLPLAAKALPIASKILPKVAPQLTRGVSQVVRTLRSNPTTKPLVRAVPTIVRRTAANIAQQAAKGQPVTSRTAAQTLARQTARVLSNPRQCVHAYQRSKAMDKRYHRGALAATRR